MDINFENRAKKKILFVCTVNRMRSLTAEKLYEHDQRFVVKSAGTDPSARVCLSEELLVWADGIVVMEKHHRNFIRKRFPLLYENKRIVCLYIEDEYEFMQQELVVLLKYRFENILIRRLL